MPQQTYTVSENVRIEIRHCHNRVIVTGWDKTDSVLTDYVAKQNGDTLTIENANKVTVRAPRSAAVSIIDCEADVRVEDVAGRVELVNIGGDLALRSLHGETLVRDLDGDLSAKELKGLQGQGTWKGDAALRVIEACNIEEIDGDVSLRNINVVRIQTVGGDLSLMSNQDAMNINEVEGDVNLRDLNGPVNIDHVGDDLIASDVKGALNLPDIHGDAIVSFVQAVNAKLVAKGDVVLRLPENIDAEIELDAPHGDLSAPRYLQVTERDDTHVKGTLGNGGVKIQVESTHGDLILEGANPMRFKHTRPPRPGEFPTPEMHEDFAKMGQDLSRLGREIAEEVRESVRASLGDMHARHRNEHLRRPHVRIERHEHRHRHEEDDEPIAEPMEQEPARPAMTQEERQALLDAIARGEVSVDDAIKKLRGEA